MIVHDSYRETFTSWAVTTKNTKVRGRDLGGELGLVRAEVSHGGRDQVNLQYIKGGKWTRLQ